MKKIPYIRFVLQVILFTTIFSCKTNYKIKAYANTRIKFEKINGNLRPYPVSFCKKSIVIVSDSTLNYSVMYGDIGNSTTIKYTLLNDILKIDTVDIYSRKSFQNCTNEIFGYEFKYSNDSLIGLNNGDRYYLSKSKEKKEPFYIIYKNRVYRIKSKKSLDRFFRKLKNYDVEKFIVLEKEMAKNKYGIDMKYKTFEYK